MSKNWSDILESINETVKKARSEGDVIWFRGQNEPWPLRSKLHRFILDLEKTAGRERQVEQKELMSLVMREFQSMYLTFGQKSSYFLPAIEQGRWGRVFSMQHYGVPTPLLDFTESFAVALYIANWNRNPTKNAALYLVDPLQINAKCHVGPHHVALNDDESDLISRSLTELYHPTLHTSVPPEMIPAEFRDRTLLRPIAVTPTAINGRMRAQKAKFILSGPSFEPINEAYKDEMIEIMLPSSTYEDSLDWLALVGFDHAEYFPDVWGVSVDFELRSAHTEKLARAIARGENQ